MSSATPFQQQQYNRNLIRQQQLANQASFFNMAQKDPYFALGNLLGNAMFTGINNRGVKKEQSELQNALASYQGDNNYQAMNDVLNNTSVISVPNANVGGGPNNSISVGLPRPDVPNPTGQPLASTPVDQNAVTLNNLAERGNIGSFNVDDFKAKYFADAQRRGRPPEQAQQAWNDMLPQIEAMDNQAKKARVNTLLSTIGNRGTNFALTNPEDLQNIADLVRNDPTMATIVMQNTANRMKNDADTAKATMNFNNQRQLNQDRFDNAVKIAEMKNNKTTNTKMSDLTAAQKSVDSITKQITDLRNMGQEVPDSLKREYNTRMAIKEALEKGVQY